MPRWSLVCHIYISNKKTFGGEKKGAEEVVAAAGCPPTRRLAVLPWQPRPALTSGGNNIDWKLISSGFYRQTVLLHTWIFFFFFTFFLAVGEGRLTQGRGLGSCGRREKVPNMAAAGNSVRRTA